MIVKIFIIILGLSLTSCSFNNFNKVDLASASSINTQLGLSYLKAGQTARAKQKLLLALKQNPNSTEVQQAMGFFFLTVNEPELAKSYYDKSLHLAPKKGEVQNNYGIFLCSTGHFNESIKYFLASSKDPNYLHNAAAYENAGICALKIPDKKLASQYFRKALYYDIMRKKSLLEMTRISLSNNQIKQADNYMKRYLSYYKPTDESLKLVTEIQKRL